MFVKALTAILQDEQEIKIGLAYDSKMDIHCEHLELTLQLILPEYRNSARSYTAYLYRSIPIPEPIDSTDSFYLMYRAFDSEYIKYVMTAHIEDYYHSNIVSWIEIPN